MLNSSKNNEKDSDKVNNEVENDGNFLFVLVTFQTFVLIYFDHDQYEKRSL